MMMGNYSQERLFDVTNSISNLKNEYMTLDERTKNIIRSEITRMTDIFVSDYEVCNNFCMKNEDKSFFTGLTVISMNIGENPKLAKVVATYAKLNFQSEVLRSNSLKDKFMLCDEYQEFCNEEDAHFFSLSREYKCINVVAMQSYSSLKNSLGKEDSAKVIIQNFVNKVWLRNDDVYTVEEITKQLGKEMRQKTNISLSESAQDSKYNLFTKTFKNMKSGITESYTITENLEQLLDTSYFTSRLKTFEAVCLLSDGLNYDVYTKVKLKMWKEGKNV
ncbi:MAG: TraM recognition domain-containing protein [Clostridia bacterium]|nr:TraM recognition domain-containing protein [Clostridia bacterium]